MSVTVSPPSVRLDDVVATSIDLAVAQWLGNPHATFAARAELRAAGIAEFEIEERRRARSSDPELARLLHFAVVAIITRGRPEERDIRRLGSSDPALIDAILAAAASSRRRVTLASVLARGTQAPPIDMNVGDY